MELKIYWNEFLAEIVNLQEEGVLLAKSIPKRFEATNEFEDKYLKWRGAVIDFFKKSFGDNNIYSKEFKFLNKSNKYVILGAEKTIQKDANQLQKELNLDINYITYNLNIFKASDLLTNQSGVDITVRQKYSSEEILDFILDKLFDLYDDNHYPILPILIGNGIKLKRSREEFEYVNHLKSIGFISSSGIANEANAQLTLNGKLYVEDKRKVKKQDYSFISDDKEIIEAKFDELFEKLYKLGLGQEIIFNELQELKSLYPRLKKKNWGELLKGKLVDLGLSQVIDKDTIKMVYEHFTNTIFQLPN